MKSNTNVAPFLIVLGGHPVRLSEVRDHFAENDQHVVVMQNGMRIALSKADGEILQRALSNRQPTADRRSRML